MSSLRTDAERHDFFWSTWVIGGAKWRNFSGFVVPPPPTATLESCDYKIEEGLVRSNIENSISKMLGQAGIMVGCLRYVDVFSPKEVDAAYSNYFDVKHGTIICNENYKFRDKTPGTKLFPSEILWQC
ncbi:hypothetical protein HBH56_242490 [Parastagonospora nodorum]|uniref:Uncharacterized protein n=1 Tax=Phaeosphaeria nodorum (strain SN15 / ATCC MYA-4574 / FGSC 10173) TaxID=321614 RepID=A0A7U2EUI3_PHANO|nr:hypothetical protein HBH56_242490 [Parastagonospora nodorum]QRC93092.1 hypothetical protein JI435_428880 [Parastagonospora nodorum SN15]KAH3921150.1 hypothetical protein HBH54_245070 [Parastagonospora nodorum]KAH4143900.1 hypothetical protein HBH45_039910 [Parastagonospora nodorum]KAH4146339.1 hypothetical protein HBH44_243500 [Parastagonospora nodorum]